MYTLQLEHKLIFVSLYSKCYKSVAIQKSHKNPIRLANLKTRKSLPSKIQPQTSE